MEKPTRESLLTLKKGIKRKKILKMFGEPDKSDRPGQERNDFIKERYGGNYVSLSPGDKKQEKKFLNMERFGYYVPGGNIMLVFVRDKLDSWKFFSGQS